MVSPLGQANVPAGFGEGSLWAATGAFGPGTGCDDVKGVGEASCGGASVPGEPVITLLKKVDPRTGEAVAAIPFEGSWGAPGLTEVAVGAGSVWVSHGEYSDPRPARCTCDVVLRVDPQTNRVVDRIPVDTPTGLAFGFGSVWVTSPTFGTLSRIDPPNRRGSGEDRCRSGRGERRGRRELGGRVGRRPVLAKGRCGC